MPVVGSAASPSAAHTDPYHLFIALATSSCHSKASSHLEERREITGNAERKRREMTPQIWPRS